MKCLENKVAVVTGASGGIGRSIAQIFAREGARVVVNYRQSENEARAVVEQIIQKGGDAVSIQADMGNAEDINSLINKTHSAFGSVDIWVNNAGADILTGAGSAVGIHEKLEHLLTVDLRGTINACWMIAPRMQDRGKGVIVNMGWDLSTHGFEGSASQIFAATKAGILGFTRSFAKTVGPDIRVNMVSPGWIATTFAEEHMDEDYYQARIDEIPLGRFGKPEDVASTVLFLASDDSSYLTGETININGGLV